MRQHLEVVAWLNLGLGVVGLFAAVVVFGTMGGAAILSGDAGAASMLLVIATFVAGILALLSVPAVVAGYGLLRRRPWARTVTLLLSFLNLLNLPFGTLIGGYSLWVLLHDDVRNMFADAALREPAR